MKKLIALLVVMAFVGVLAATVYARTATEELNAVRGYLSLLDQKIIKYRKMGNAAMVSKLRGEKDATLLRLAKLKAQAEAEQAAPVMRKVVQAAPSGLLGLGWLTDISAGYVAGKSVIGLRGDIVLDDPFALGNIVGLSADSVKYKVGLGYTQGKDGNDVDWKTIPLYVDGILLLPAEAMGGVETYIGGGLNYVLYRSGQKSGTLGGEVYLGVQGDLGLGGNTFAELGYTVLRTGAVTGADTAHTSRGISISVGQEILL